MAQKSGRLKTLHCSAEGMKRGTSGTKQILDHFLSLHIKDGFKGNDSLISWMLAPPGCFLCVKNTNKGCLLDKLSQSFSDTFHNPFTWQKIIKSIIKIAPDINKDLRNVFTVQTIQDISKFK